MSPKIIILTVIGFFGLIVGAALVISIGQKPEPATVSFSAQDKDRPKVETGEIFFDGGEMKVSEVKQKDYTFKNTGNKPLQILNINSSCNCVIGQLIYKGLTSNEFGMHNQSGFVTEIDPGDSATLRLIYRPAIMPVYGVVVREVYVTTNDPEKEKLVFSFKVVVK